MATNRFLTWGRQIALPVASGKVSGDPAVCGQIPGVCLTDRDAGTGKATLQLDGVFLLDVVGNDGSAAAVAIGDIVYYNSGTLNVNDAGVRFGYALDAVLSGATTEIRVKIGY